MPRFVSDYQAVLYDESGHTEVSLFVPRSYDVAQARLSPYLGFTQDLLTSAHPNYRFRQATPQHTEFTSTLAE